MEPNQYSWDGETPIKTIEIRNKTNGDCACVHQLKVAAIPCEEKHYFMCESVSGETQTSVVTQKCVFF